MLKALWHFSPLFHGAPDGLHAELSLVGNSVESSLSEKKEKNQNQQWKHVPIFFFCMILQLVK